MENPTEFTESNNDPFLENEKLTLSKYALTYIKEAASWAQFLSILGFILVAIMLVFSVIMFFMFGSLNDEFNIMPFDASLFSVLYVLIAILYFFPVYYLFQFSNGMKKALISIDSLALEEGFRNLKSHYKFIGILAIIMIGFYVIAIVGSLLFSLSF